ncbi:hypothetical protein BOTNAR_0171g00020 [Botryotinia narcissicola]|uniref:Uncharacterized protein n=1 Tax=Botryotinia narcissicola TaxID=278944 RepID=A0A4Z1IBJ4_9HELO|nr:hypothetical protein BOTNAR_0171g00020 [Botryotinia narcissicola]
MPSLPPRLLQNRSTFSPSSLKPRLDLTRIEYPSAPDVPFTPKQEQDFDNMLKNLPEDSKKKLEKLKREHGLTRNQLILAGLKKWAPDYVDSFKMAMFFGIV